MPTQKLTPEIITAAIEGFEQQKARTNTKIAELRAMLPGGPAKTAATPEPPKRKRRKMSAAGRARIAEAQRKRWAESRKAAEPSTPEAPKAKRKLSAAGRKAIIAATKRRWALKRAEAAKAAKTAAKKPAKNAAAKRTAVKAAPAKAAKKAVAKRLLKMAPASAPTVAEAAQ